MKSSLHCPFWTTLPSELPIYPSSDIIGPRKIVAKVSLRIQLEAKAADQTLVVVPIHLQALQVCPNICNYADHWDTPTSMQRIHWFIIKREYHY